MLLILDFITNVLLCKKKRLFLDLFYQLNCQVIYLSYSSKVAFNGHSSIIHIYICKTKSFKDIFTCSV